MAPELFRGEACSLESDVYAFAIMLWETFSADTPFSGCSQISEIKDKVPSPCCTVMASGCAVMASGFPLLLWLALASLSSESFPSRAACEGPPPVYALPHLHSHHIKSFAALISLPITPDRSCSDPPRRPVRPNSTAKPHGRCSAE